MIGFTRSSGPVAVLALLALLVTGCGTSNYNALMGRRLAALRVASKFEGLYASTALPGTPFSIRVPLEFEHSYQQKSSHDDDGGAINPDRLQPPFLKLPGFKLCYEGINRNGETETPFYCYLAATPSQPGAADKVIGQISNQLNAAFATQKKGDPKADKQKEIKAETIGDWAPVDADTPEGKNLHWRRIRVEGEQPFLVKTGGKVAPQKMPGIFEVWVYDAEQYVVIVAWRAPSALDRPAPAPAADANPLEPQPAAATGVSPDLSTMPVKTAGTLTSSGGG